MSDPILDEVHEARRIIFEEAGNDLHVLFQRLREAEKKHPERVVELPRCASIDDPPRIIPYAGSEDPSARPVPSSDADGFDVSRRGGARHSG